MTTLDLRIEIGKLLEREQDASILEAIRNLLRKTTLDQTLREKLTGRALQAEKEIKAGLGHTREELERDTDHLTRE
jgi:hypothetical protein